MKYMSLLVMVLCAVLLSGCATTTLLDGARRHDGDLVQFDRAFATEGDLVVEFTIRSCGNRIATSKHWVELDLTQKSGRTESVKIHREPLPSSIAESLRPAIVRDVAQFVSRAPDGHMKTDSIREYAESLPLNQLPLVLFFNEVSESRDGLVSRSTYYFFVGVDSTGQPRTLRPGPITGSYIPSSQYPRIAVLWPFAAVYDFLTYPFLLMMPRIG
jgi:hypothetical protein